MLKFIGLLIPILFLSATEVHEDYYDRLLGKTMQLSKNTTFQQFLIHYQRGILNFESDEIAYFVGMQNSMQKCLHFLDNKKKKNSAPYNFKRANDFYVQLVRPMYKNTVAKGKVFAYGTEPRTAQTFSSKYPKCAEYFTQVEEIPEKLPNFYAEQIFYPANNWYDFGALFWSKPALQPCLFCQ